MITKDYILGFLTAILWGGNFLFTKLGVEGLGIFGNTIIRSLCIVIVIPFLTKIRVQKLKELFVLSLIYNFGFLTFINISLIYTDNLPLIIILVQTVVPFGSILSYYFYKEKITPGELTGMFVALVGITVLVGIPKEFTSIIAIIAILTAAFSQAYQMIYIREKLTEIKIFQLLFWMHLLGLPIITFFSLVFEGSFAARISNASPEHWFGSLYSGLISTLIGFYIWFYLTKKYSVTRVTPFMLLVPIFGIIFTNLYFGDQINREIIIGGMLTISGVAVIQFSKRQKS